MGSRFSHAAGLLALLLALEGLACFLFSLTTPIGEGPDEPAHLEYVREMPGALGGARAAEIMEKRRHGYELHQPPLYYWIASTWARFLHAELDYPWLANPEFPKSKKGGAFLAPTKDDRERRARSGVRQVRWLGLLFGAATVAAAWQVARKETGNRLDLAVLVAVPFVLAPQLAFLCGAVSNDGLTFAICAWALWQHRRIQAGDSSFGFCCLAGLATGAAPWAKLSGFVLLPTFLVAAWTLGRRKSWRSLAALLLPAAFLGSGWLVSQPGRFSMLRQLAGDHRLSLWQSPELLGSDPLWWLQLWISYWAKLTWFQLRLPLPLYLLYLPSTLLVLAGLRLAWRERARLSSSPACFWALALLANLGLYGVFVLFVDFQHQGRLLYPTLAAAVGLAGLALAEIEKRRTLPAFLKGRAVYAVIAVFFALQLAAVAVIVADEGWPLPL